MSVKSMAPIAISTTPISQDLTVLNLSTYGEIKVANTSPNPLQVGIGSDLHWLDYWSADVFCLQGARSVFLTPIVVQSPAPLAPVASVLISVAERPGEIPGVYPTNVAAYVSIQQAPVSTSLSNAGKATAPVASQTIAGRMVDHPMLGTEIYDVWCRTGWGGTADVVDNMAFAIDGSPIRTIFTPPTINTMGPQIYIPKVKVTIAPTRNLAVIAVANAAAGTVYLAEFDMVRIV